MNGIHLIWIMNILNTMGNLIGQLIPTKTFSLTQTFDEFGDYVNRSLSILDILDETPKISPIHNLLVNKHVFQ